MIRPIQVPSIVLPQAWTRTNDTEIINDIVTHPSLDIPCDHLQEKTAHILAWELIAAGVPGNLLCWVEISPIANTNLWWSAIGGGGNRLPPVAPSVIIATGVADTLHNIHLSWTQHAAYCRIVVQTPVMVATAGWAIEVVFEGKG